jgi:3-hydroxyacyl-CoA dehydrogenase
MGLAIKSIAIIGGGTMGSGIAALAAVAGCSVLLLETDRDAAEHALKRALATAESPQEQAQLQSHISIGTIDSDIARIADADWVCEAIVEDLAAKRALFSKIEPLRRPGSVVSTNTSGIRLSDITSGSPDSLRRDIAVTHFFNPVRVMRLMELAPGAQTRPEVIAALADFARTQLGKGVVHVKDTVNFVGNRIGCFWMLSGLHKAKPFLAQGLTQETIDSLMGAPVGLPSTGLYGLIDLIGLDVMDFVGKNLAANLPPGDIGLAYAEFPPVEAAMLARGQLGRKSGGGFYRIRKLDDGVKIKEVFDLVDGDWRPARPAALSERQSDARTLLFETDAAGELTWDLLGGALFYAADLIPEIADDIVNVDRAMRWGFAWRRGPLELMDQLGPARIIARLDQEKRRLPRMLAVLREARADTFYRNGEFLGVDGDWRPIPPE